MRTHQLLRRTTAALAIATVAGVAQAQTIPGPRNADNCFPFGCSSISRYQQVYRGSLFGGSTVGITALTFFNSILEIPTEDTRLTRGTYNLFLSTTSSAVGGLNTANLNSNRGADFAAFGTLTVTGTVTSAPSFTIAGTAFTFNPLAGNLLLEIESAYTESRPNSSTAAFLDANSSGVDASRAGCNGAACNSSTIGGPSIGLITQFTTRPTTVIPEPSTYALMATGLVALGLIRRRRA
jgi:hypothetical protein